MGSVKNDTILGRCDVHREGLLSEKTQAGCRVGAEHELILEKLYWYCFDSHMPSETLSRQ